MDPTDLRVVSRHHAARYWLSTYEVTNRQFKRFVDAGGYQNRKYWKEPITRDGRTLSWPEAAAQFRDRTGRPGPSAWELSAFPAGAENLPVTGVSWYEAAAYAEFAGESLPTLHEWNRAAGISVNANIVLLSNFGAQGPVAVGSRRGMSPFGSFDMAGNVKEWTATSVDDERYVLGGGWDEPRYAFSSRDARPPLSRESSLGFRTIKRVDPPPAAIFDPVPNVTEKLHEPAGDVEYRVFESLHRYESSPLDARTGTRRRHSPYWRRETLSFRAAYGEERVARPSVSAQKRVATIPDRLRARRQHHHERSEAGRRLRLSLRVHRPVRAGRCHSRAEWHARARAVAHQLCRRARSASVRSGGPRTSAGRSSISISGATSTSSGWACTQ